MSREARKSGREEVKRVPWRMMVIGLVVVVLFSFLAGVFNSGKGTVEVSRISFETPNGTLSGLLYKPRGVDDEHPAPTVIVTHGYLNSAEMQDANAIELSRRGYVVLALDMYDHGHSDLDNKVYEGFAAFGDFFKTWAPFWVNSMHDAVQYMYDQPYVLKDEKGNGIIGVTGHSMGGFSSTLAVVNDEQLYAATGIRKIYANLTEGSDFQYTGLLGVHATTFDQAGGGRWLGKVAAQYDEFFFNNPNDPAGTVRKKDYVSTPDGMTFLEQVEPGKANTWYATADGGHRIIYEPAQTHPWNHFSTLTTGYAVDFYNTAFAAFMGGAPAAEPAPAEEAAPVEDAAPEEEPAPAEEAAPEVFAAPVWDASEVKAGAAGGSAQIWYWKEICECIALIGFVLFILGSARTLLRAPFFRKACTREVTPLPSPRDGKLGATIAILIIAILLPALLFETLYGWDPKSGEMSWLRVVTLVLGAAGVTFALCSLGKTRQQRKTYAVGGCFVVAAAAGLTVLARCTLYGNSSVWTAPVINDVAKWTVGCMFMALIIMSLVFVFMKAKEGVTLADYGVTFRPLPILASLCMALLVVGGAFGLLFLMDRFFKADFRIWTFAFKTFDANILPAVLRYLPTFLAFYIVSTASIFINTNTERLQGWKGYALAILLNAGGAFFWLVRQYVTLFSTGVAAHPNAALSGIVLVAMVPTLAIAAVISRCLYKRTGNIWTPAFINGILMTIMAVANTTVYFK